jgi:hypothetical protein
MPGHSHGQAVYPAAASAQSLEEVFGSPFEPPPPPPPPRRSASSRMLHRSPRIRPDTPPDGSYTAPSRLPFRVVCSPTPLSLQHSSAAHMFARVQAEPDARMP